MPSFKIRPCTVDAQCGPNQRCDIGRGSCRSSFGGSCMNQEDCMQGNCFQFYCRRLSDNASCTSHEDCASNFCDADNTCQQTTYFFNSLRTKIKRRTETPLSSLKNLPLNKDPRGLIQVPNTLTRFGLERDQQKRDNLGTKRYSRKWKGTNGPINKWLSFHTS